MNQNDLSQLQILQRAGPSFYRKNNKPSTGKQQKQERAQKHDKKQHHREMNEAKRGFVIRQK